jgi:uncharacterized protein
MKFLLLLVVLGVALMWWLAGRRRGPEAVQRKADPRAPAGGPATMIACAHCGVHLPRPDALFDAGGRPFCSEAHRLAGPRPPQG